MKSSRHLSFFGRIAFMALIAMAAGIALLIIRPWDRFYSGTAGAAAESSESPAAESADSSPSAKTSEYAANKAVNSDYVGHLAFESGLVDQNVVQSADNEKYLNLSWDLQSSTHGAAFMDCRNTQDDQNLIVYGHFVYLDESLMFSPLHQLKEESSYEANEIIKFQFENETRKYLVTDVFYYEMDSDTLQYYYTAYDPDYFRLYYQSVKAADFYDTGETLTLDDRWITLQTCVRDRDDLRLIVLAKQIGS
ncbi:MAG: class B sortase [Erysipelotrichia bacterium]|nr:class B sortase [Erysipelotrichia bacterium]